MCLLVAHGPQSQIANTTLKRRALCDHGAARLEATGGGDSEGCELRVNARCGIGNSDAFADSRL